MNEIEIKYRIEFDEPTHKYKVNGEPKPCVSDIWNKVIKNDEPISEFAKPYMYRGTLVHLMIQMFNNGTLDESSIDKQLKGYFDSYLAFKEKHKHTSLRQEIRCYDPVNGICGSVDDDGLLKEEPWILDYKTGGLYPDYKWKLAGYKTMLVNMHDKAAYTFHKVGAVQLFKDGKCAKLIPYDWEMYRYGWDALCLAYHIKTGRWDK